VARGFYRLSEKPALTNPDLVAVALRIPRAVICLISSLAHHGLTTDVPHTVDVALPGHAQIPKLGGIRSACFGTRSRPLAPASNPSRLTG